MEKYFVEYSTKSLNDIDSIFFYVAAILGNINSSIKIFYTIKAKIDSLEFFPERFQYIEGAPDHLKNMRAAYVGKYTIYYRVIKEELIVKINRVVYSGTNLNQIAID